MLQSKKELRAKISLSSFLICGYVELWHHYYVRRVSFIRLLGHFMFRNERHCLKKYARLRSEEWFQICSNPSKIFSLLEMLSIALSLSYTLEFSKCPQAQLTNVKHFENLLEICSRVSQECQQAKCASASQEKLFSNVMITTQSLFVNCNK